MLVWMIEMSLRKVCRLINWTLPFCVCSFSSLLSFVLNLIFPLYFGLFFLPSSPSSSSCQKQKYVEDPIIIMELQNILIKSKKAILNIFHVNKKILVNIYTQEESTNHIHTTNPVLIVTDNPSYQKLNRIGLICEQTTRRQQTW